MGVMKDGQIGIITMWNDMDYVGNIVQRFENHLVCIGDDSYGGWPNHFDTSRNNSHLYRVRLLGPGTMLRIVT